MQKRPFILLEVLVALTLVALCAIPLIIKPIRIYRSEMRLLEEGEGERLADWTFSEIKEQLLQNTIPWEKLPSFHQTTEPFLLKSASIFIPGRVPKEIRRSFTLYGKGEKTGEGGEVYRMLHVKIVFDPQLSQRKKRENLYTYRTIIQRKKETNL